MSFKVEITAYAEVDIGDAYRWIHRDSPARAAAWRTKLLQHAETLNTFPERCPLAPENDAFDEEIRQLIYGKRQHAYRILFTIEGSIVRILHIRHGARRHLRQHKTPEENP